MGTRLAHRCKSASAAVLAVCSYVLAALSAGQIAAIRLLRPLVFPFGASVGFYPVAVFSVRTMAPYAIMVGYVLPFTLFVEGRPAFSAQDRSLAEEMVHYPLSQIQRPENILLISTAAGIMEEIEKYHPRPVDYIELDASMAELLFEYRLMPAVRGLHMIHTDARQWLRESQTRYDAILMNLPEPRTFQINRFFTDQFFEIVRMHLHAQGIFSFSAVSIPSFRVSGRMQSGREPVQRP